MADDSKHGGPVPAAESNAVEICSNCGERFTVAQGHHCTSMTADYMQSSEVAPVGERVPDDDGLVGRVLGNDQYVVLERISQGGMGVVYKARHKQLGSLVAVKVLHRADDPSFQQRFLREAQLAAKIKHPNIVYISDFGVLPDGGSFLVMEYLEGKTLTQAMSGFRLEVARALRISLQLVRGILAAHNLGIIHRDLKPGNIFLVDKVGVPETVKIIDFGIAKGLHPDGSGVPPSGAWAMMGQHEIDKEDVQRTMSSLIGTPGYMAPEQVRGTLTDARTDQYAIGCILYQMLTGTLVFTHSMPQDLLLMHLVEPPEPPKKRLPELDISNELEEMVLRLLAKEPEDRYPSLQDVEAELALELSLYEGAQQPSQSSFRSGQNLALRSVTPSQISARQLTQAAQPSRGSAPSQSSVKSDAVDAVPAPSTPSLPPRRRNFWQFIAGLAGLGLITVGIGYRLMQTPQAVPAAHVTSDSMQRTRERALAVLSEQARHRDPQLRRGALSTLGQSREVQALPILQGVYHGGSDSERAAALQAIGQLGERQAVPLLQAALREAGAPAVKAAAAQALMALGEEGGVQFLERELASDDKAAQQRAALLLCERGHRQAAERLSTLLEGLKPLDEQALSALSCQARTGQLQAHDKLVARLREAQSDTDKLRVATRLNQLGDGSGRTLLSGFAEKAGPQQLTAAWLLASPNQTAGAELFRQVARDGKAELSARTTALLGLGASGQLDDLSLLESLLDVKTNAALRQAAAGSALRLAGRDESLAAAHNLSWARAAVGDANWLVRHAAVPLIAENEAPDSMALLSQSLHDARPEVRLRAAHTLGKRRDFDALRSLAGALADSELSVRQAVARAMLRVADAVKETGRATSELSAWLTERVKLGTPEEQALCRASLLRLGDAAQSAEVSKLATAPSAEVRAIVALASLDDPQFLSTLLADRELDVRFIAALRLANKSDRRGVPVLIEVLKRGGTDMLRAYGALLRLGESAGTPPALENLQKIDQVGARLALIDAAEVLPLPEAVSLLTQAEHDPEPFARRLAAEVAAELTSGSPGSPLLGILTRLAEDPLPLVSTRAEALLTRVLRGPHAAAQKNAAESGSGGEPK